MKTIFITFLAGCLLLMAGCGHPSFDQAKYQQDQRNQRIFLQEEVRVLEYPPKTINDEE